ncbi:MAG: hypothetical protein ACXIVQ_02410 [Acidimicrobiales bacterium]
MPLRRLALFAVAPLLLLACGDDDIDLGTDTDDPDSTVVEEGEPTVEPQGGIGDAVVYDGAVETDAPWELTVTVTGVECGIEVDDDLEVVGEDEQLCAATVSMENTGQEANSEDFWQASSVLTVEGDTYEVSDTISVAYAEQQGVEPEGLIAPGDSAELPLVFALPLDDEPAYLYLQAGAADDVVIIDLG